MENIPALQVKQDEAFVLLGKDDWPAGHNEQAEDPAELYVPAAQLKQPVPPVEYVPAGQA